MNFSIMYLNKKSLVEPKTHLYFQFELKHIFPGGCNWDVWKKVKSFFFSLARVRELASLVSSPLLGKANESLVVRVSMRLIMQGILGMMTLNIAPIFDLFFSLDKLTNP